MTYKSAYPEAQQISLPNGRYPNFGAFGVIKEVTEELKECLEM